MGDFDVLAAQGLIQCLPGTRRAPSEVLRYVRVFSDDQDVLVPVGICVGCFIVGASATARWLPDFARGSVGGFTFFVVCGLLGAATAVFALRIYVLAEIHSFGEGVLRNTDVASSLEQIMWECGLLVALAVALYLQAPKPERPVESAPESPGAGP
jgi:hypothetical protein